MDTRLFRKSSIERLASPEELDQIIKVSQTGTWAALAAVLMLCGAASVWAVQGRIPTTAVGNAMIVVPTGVLTVVARGGGTVRSIDVAVGSHVEADQPVATIAQPSLDETLRGLQAALAELRVKRDRDLKRKADEIQMRAEAIGRNRANGRRSIGDIEQEVKLAEAQVPVMEQLFSRGLVTNQQVIAARQKLVELRGRIENHRAELTQFDAQELELRSQMGELDSEMQFQIATKERELAALQKELALRATVVAPQAGVVLEIKVSPGGTVATDAPILTVQLDSNALEALAYVSALQAKEIRPGMEARVSPSTVKREEYGFIRGEVSFVADYPASTAALMRNFLNEQVVGAIAAGGPVTEVRVKLEPDPASPSGFRWSSPGGPPTRISAGTLAITEIVTQRRAPITFVIPLLREKLGAS